MTRIQTMLAAIALAFTGALVAKPAAAAGTLQVELVPASSNPASPRMGDRLALQSTIRNTGTAPVEGLIAWLSLVQVDKGQEQPVDLEDWSAHKAITMLSLAPGGSVETRWPMRLIQSGHYRVVVSAVSRDSASLTPSPFVDFTVWPKPVVESGRLLSVAVGVPMLLAGSLLVGLPVWRRRT